MLCTERFLIDLSPSPQSTSLSLLHLPPLRPPLCPLPPVNLLPPRSAWPPGASQALRLLLSAGHWPPSPSSEPFSCTASCTTALQCLFSPFSFVFPVASSSLSQHPHSSPALPHLLFLDPDLTASPFAAAVPVVCHGRWLSLCPLCVSNIFRQT